MGCSTILGIEDLPTKGDSGAPETGPPPPSDGGKGDASDGGGAHDTGGPDTSSSDTGAPDSGGMDAGGDAGLPTCTLDDAVKGILDQCILAP